MTHTAYAIALFEWFGYVRADGEDGASVVAAEEGAGGGEVVEVFPVGGVKGDEGGGDEEVGVSEMGEGAVRVEEGVGGGGDFEGFLRGHGFFFLVEGGNRVVLF